MHQPTRQTQEVTFSISVPSAVHAGIGVGLAAIAIIAFVIHIELPKDSPHRISVATIAAVAAFATMSYWLWCVMQHLRADHVELGEAIAANRAEARQRQESIFEAFAEIGARLSELSEEIGENRNAIKGLADAVDDNTGKVEESIGAVEALQDCYIDEGQAQRTEDPDTA